jgi:hypothetical protein
MGKPVAHAKGEIKNTVPRIQYFIDNVPKATAEQVPDLSTSVPRGLERHQHLSETDVTFTPTCPSLALPYIFPFLFFLTNVFARLLNSFVILNYFSSFVFNLNGS